MCCNPMVSFLQVDRNENIGALKLGCEMPQTFGARQFSLWVVREAHRILGILEVIPPFPATRSKCRFANIVYSAYLPQYMALMLMFSFPVPLSLRSGIPVQYSHVNPGFRVSTGIRNSRTEFTEIRNICGASPKFRILVKRVLEFRISGNPEFPCNTCALCEVSLAIGCPVLAADCITSTRGLTTTMSSLSAQYPSKTLRVSNLVSYALLIAVNVASNSGLLGPTNAEISQKYSTPLTPAG